MYYLTKDGYVFKEIYLILKLKLTYKENLDGLIIHPSKDTPKDLFPTLTFNGKKADTIVDSQDCCPTLMILDSSNIGSLRSYKGIADKIDNGDSVVMRLEDYNMLTLKNNSEFNRQKGVTIYAISNTPNIKYMVSLESMTRYVNKGKARIDNDVIRKLLNANTEDKRLAIKMLGQVDLNKYIVDFMQYAIRHNSMFVKDKRLKTMMKIIGMNSANVFDSARILARQGIEKQTIQNFLYNV